MNEVNLLHHLSGDYVTINKYFIKKGDLSISAIAVLLTVKMLPENCFLNFTKLSKHLNISVNTLKKIFNELEDKKYLKREKKIENDENSAVDWFFYEIPWNKLKGDPLESMTIRVNQSIFNTAKLNIAKKSKPKTKIYDNNSQEYIMANYLYNKVLNVNRYTEKQDINKWANSFFVMTVVQGKSLIEVKELIDWIFTDSFWQTVIDSPYALNRNWGKLKLNKNRSKNKPESGFTSFTEEEKQEIAKGLK